MKYRNTTCELKLMELMSDISKEGICASLMKNLEFDLWRLVTSNKTNNYCRHEVSSKELFEMQMLSLHIDGWVAHEDSIPAHLKLYPISYWGCYYIPLEDWTRIYEEFKLK